MPRMERLWGKLPTCLLCQPTMCMLFGGGEREWLIPAVEEFVVQVNVDEDYMLVNRVEGL